MIDFTTFFAKHEIERLEFRTRRDVNYHHDIIFLSSYLHDATFTPQDFRWEGQQLMIDVHRDCWEFWTRIHRVRDELLGCRSRLSISGIDSLEWSVPQPAGEVMIRSVFIGERQHIEAETAHLVILSMFPDLRIDLVGSDSFFDIELIDQEDPN